MIGSDQGKRQKIQWQEQERQRWWQDKEFPGSFINRLDACQIAMRKTEITEALIDLQVYGNIFEWFKITVGQSRII